MTSVRPSDCHAGNWVVSAWIDVALGMYSCGLWHVNACLNKFLRALWWAHERFEDTAVVLFVIIFGRVKF